MMVMVMMMVYVVWEVGCKQSLFCLRIRREERKIFEGRVARGAHATRCFAARALNSPRKYRVHSIFGGSFPRILERKRHCSQSIWEHIPFQTKEKGSPTQSTLKWCPTMVSEVLNENYHTLKQSASWYFRKLPSKPFILFLCIFQTTGIGLWYSCVVTYIDSDHDMWFQKISMYPPPAPPQEGHWKFHRKRGGGGGSKANLFEGKH